MSADKGIQASVEMAKSLKLIRDNWPAHLDFIQLQAEIVRERYQRLLKVGFTEAQALELCTRTVSL